MYCIHGNTIHEIIKKCDFVVSKPTIYTILKENNILLNRKTISKHISIVGNCYGQLTVTNITHTEKSGKRNNWRALCTCSCGKTNIDVNPLSLINGTTKSCGCNKEFYSKFTGKNSPKFTGYEEISGRHWGTIVRQTKDRNLIVEIDIKYAWNLYLKQERKCALSGLPLKFTTANKKFEETASLDRIDSTKGYIEGNVQWVHKHINMMKNVHEQNYFISLCKLIANNHS